MMHCKGIAICHNQAHEKTLRRLLVDYVVADLSKKRELSKFAPPDMRDRFNKAKPERLIQYESQTNTDNPGITAATATWATKCPPVLLAVSRGNIPTRKDT